MKVGGFRKRGGGGDDVFTPTERRVRSYTSSLLTICSAALQKCGSLRVRSGN